MKIHRHNLAMQWITRRRTNEVQGKADPFYTEFKNYQSALSDGFEGTMDDYTVQTFEQGPRSGYQAAGSVGSPTGMVTEYGRKVYETPGGEKVSEKSVTLQMGDTWINVPSIHGGKMYNQAQLEQMLMSGKIQPSSVHNSEQEAVNAAMSRSDTMQSERVGHQGGQLVDHGPELSRRGTPKVKGNLLNFQDMASQL